MRSYCAIYVDVGYLLAAAATRVTGTSLRRGVDVDHPELIRALIDKAEEDSGLPLLRVNWYDSGARPGGMPDFVQDEIGLLPRVKLRLGRLSHAGEQKGVDLRIGLDLATHGRNRVVDVIYLVSGDDDLTEAVEEAQGHGVQLILLAVPGQDGRPHGVARHLQRAADGLVLLDGATVDHVVRSKAIPEPLVPDEFKTSTADVEAGVVDGAVSTVGTQGAVPEGALAADLPSEAVSQDAAAEGALLEGGEPSSGISKDAAAQATGSETSAAGDRTATESTTDPARSSREEAGADAARPNSTPAPAAHNGAPAPAEGVDPARGDLGRPEHDQPDHDRPDHARPENGQPDHARPDRERPDHAPAGDGEPAPALFAAGAEQPSGPTPSLFAKRKATTLVPPPEPVWTTATGAEPSGTFVGASPELIDIVARQVIRSWCTTATPEDLALLKRQRPSIPPDLDRALLMDLSNRSEQYDIDEVSRHDLRARFWQLLDQVKLT